MEKQEQDCYLQGVEGTLPTGRASELHHRPAEQYKMPTARYVPGLRYLADTRTTATPKEEASFSFQPSVFFMQRGEVTQTPPLDNGGVKAKASLTASSIPAPASTATFQTPKDSAQDWSRVHCLLPQTLQGPNPIRWMKEDAKNKDTKQLKPRATKSRPLCFLGSPFWGPELSWR